MPGRSRERVRELGRALLIGSLVGFVVLAGIVVAWRERQEEPIVLTVNPVDNATLIRVYVDGAVGSPGIYSLPRGSRIADAIEMAGGVKENADLTGLGMAAVIHDSDMITVPQLAPTATATVMSTEGRSTAATVGQVPPSTLSATSMTGALIDINRASVRELDTLPRIGPVIAQRIIDYREQHGPFQSIGELVEIRGISDRMVETLRPLVTLGP